jgi:site-specific DNA-cytosine methylase
MELVCVNHWPVAIETHSKNHPEARHYCQDISTVRPHIIVPEGYLDLLMASPTCTHHSVARGGKPTSDQQRSDPWHIITWLTELRVKRLIIENVWEFCGWGPVDARTGKPIKSRKGEYFRAWIDTIRRLGFEPEWRKLNAADYGDATTRQRFILMARSDGKLGILAGPDPHQEKRRAAAVDPEAVAAGARDHRLVDQGPLDLRPQEAAGAEDAGADLCRRAEIRLARAVPRGAAQPHGRAERRPPAADDRGERYAYRAGRADHLSPRHGKEGAGPRPVSRRCAAAADDHGRGQPDGLGRAVHPQPPRRRLWHRSRAFARRARADRERRRRRLCSSSRSCCPATPRARRADRRADAHPGRQAFALPDLALLRLRLRRDLQAAEEPLPTVTSKGPLRHGGARHPQPGRQRRARRRRSPADADDGQGRRIRHGDAGDARRPLRSRARCRRSAADRDRRQPRRAGLHHRAVRRAPGQAPRVHDIGTPAPAICATGHINLVEATPSYDILFRMLEPHELAAAMGFDGEEAKYEFAGTKTEKIKQIGNAGLVAKMKACVGAIMSKAHGCGESAAERGARMKHPMVDFLFYLLAALMVLAMLPIGIGLMIAFTIADCAVRMSGRLWRAGR